MGEVGRFELVSDDGRRVTVIEMAPVGSSGLRTRVTADGREVVEFVDRHDPHFEIGGCPGIRWRRPKGEGK